MVFPTVTARMQPRYHHDCPRCRFVCTMHMGGKKLVDWYVCTPDRSVVARRSSEGSDYWSSPVSIVDEHAKVAYDVDGSKALSHMHILAREILRSYRAHIIDGV